MKPKRGDINTQGLMYWGTRRGVESWVTPEEFRRMRALMKGYLADYYSRNKEKFKISSRQSKERLKHLRWAKDKARMDANPIEKLKQRLSIRLWNALHAIGTKKSCLTMDVIGCSREHLLAHIEKQFRPGMTWDNYGKYGWHVDHIIPLASAKTIEELLKLNHYTNLQPLWAKENLSKGDKYEPN